MTEKMEQYFKMLNDHGAVFLEDGEIRVNPEVELKIFEIHEMLAGSSKSRTYINLGRAYQDMMDEAEITQRAVADSGQVSYIP